MKKFNSVWSLFNGSGAILGVMLCVVMLAATRPLDDKKREMVVLGTPYGEMTLMLYDETPLHKANFLKLVGESYYDSLLFHRVIKAFMVQGGDPDSKGAPSEKQLGMGGPGYTIPAEINEAFIHKKGALAAARLGDQANPKRESSGSQFYIVHGTNVDENRLKGGQVSYSPEQVETYLRLGGTPHLDGAYTVFGEVVEGLNVIDSLAVQPTNRANRPLKDIPMTMKIVRKRWP
jgi:cyclophilin family peptidyl-prolyl cis-trans isomerase